MNEQKEAIIRQQTILMMYRNHGNNYVIRRVLKRFIRCIKGG